MAAGVFEFGNLGSYWLQKNNKQCCLTTTVICSGHKMPVDPLEMFKIPFHCELHVCNVTLRVTLLRTDLQWRGGE